MTEPSTERRLFREAMDLAIRLQNDPRNEISIAMVRSWAARSPEHARAWDRVARVHGVTGKVLAEERRGAQAPMPSRRQLLMGGMSVVGLASVGTIIAPGMLVQARADHLTDTAEFQRIALSDGSAMTLGPASAVTIEITPTRRSIGLLKGMVFVDAVKDPSRNFSIQCEGVTARMSEAAMNLSEEAGTVSISVEKGDVDVNGSHSAPLSANRLSAGEWLNTDQSGTVLQRGKQEVLQLAGWRDGYLTADRETVGAMIAKIARWLPERVVIADPWLGSRLVSGVFDTSDPVGAIEAVIRPFDAKVRVMRPLLIVISAA